MKFENLDKLFELYVQEAVRKNIPRTRRWKTISACFSTGLKT